MKRVTKVVMGVVVVALSGIHLSEAASSQRGPQITLAPLQELQNRFEEEGLMDVIDNEDFKRACNIEKIAGTQQSVGALRACIRFGLISLSYKAYVGKELDEKAGLIERLLRG